MFIILQSVRSLLQGTQVCPIIEQFLVGLILLCLSNLLHILLVSIESRLFGNRVAASPVHTAVSDALLHPAMHHIIATDEECMAVAIICMNQDQANRDSRQIGPISSRISSGIPHREDPPEKCQSQGSTWTTWAGNTDYKQMSYQKRRIWEAVQGENEGGERTPAVIWND